MTGYVSVPVSGFSPIVFDEACQAVGYTLGDGLVWPVFDYRRTHYADSRFVTGKQLQSVIKDQTSLDFVGIVRDTSTANLETRVAAVEAALSAWTYDVTLHMDGVSRVYPAEPNIPAWGKISIGLRRLYTRIATISIPINPPS